MYDKYKFLTLTASFDLFPWLALAPWYNIANSLLLNLETTFGLFFVVIDICPEKQV
jgi:hypothetical protein